jgi:hypothetical protein
MAIIVKTFFIVFFAKKHMTYQTVSELSAEIG